MKKLIVDSIDYQRSDRQSTIDSTNVNSDDDDDDDEVMIQKCSLNLLKLKYLVIDDLFFRAIE